MQRLNLDKKCSKLQRALLWLVAVFFLVSCTQSETSGPITMYVIQPTPNSCSHTIAPARILTLTNVNEMRGKVGRVVYFGQDFAELTDLEALKTLEGFNPVSVNFSQSGSRYYPLDMGSLFAASLYYAIETAHLLFTRIDPSANLIQAIPNHSDTLIIQRARIADAWGASYVPYPENPSQTSPANNFFFSYVSREDMTDLPFATNLGVMVHEYTHMVFQHLARKKLNAAGYLDGEDRTTYTIGALNEGLADYFGFLASGDPKFLLCSLRNSHERDMSVLKPEEDVEDLFSKLENPGERGPFLIHEGGGIFAAIQYHIGERLKAEGTGDHETHAKSLIALMKTLQSCGTSGSKFSMHFGKVRQCHLEVVDSSTRSIVSEVYNKGFRNFTFGQE